jgi:hypothetical protein
MAACPPQHQQSSCYCRGEPIVGTVAARGHGPMAHGVPQNNLLSETIVRIRVVHLT